MKRETLFLKVVIFLMAIPVLAVCIFVLPLIATLAGEINPELPSLEYLFLMVMYVTAIAYFVALYQALRLLSYIDKNKAFSELSVKALKNIKYCAITISILYVMSMPVILFMAELDDAPGFAALGAVITFGSLAIAVFAAVLQKLLQNAIDIKSENDLTV
jgi:hypothetical protein